MLGNVFGMLWWMFWGCGWGLGWGWGGVVGWLWWFGLDLSWWDRLFSSGPPSNTTIVDILKTNEFKRQRKKLLMHWRTWWPSLNVMDTYMISRAPQRNVPKHQELSFLKKYCPPSCKYLSYVAKLEGDDDSDLGLEPRMELWRRPRGRLPNIPHVYAFENLEIIF